MRRALDDTRRFERGLAPSVSWRFLLDAPDDRRVESRGAETRLACCADRHQVPFTMTPVRVLVIEDDADARQGLVLLLEARGCTVLAACDGSEGLRLARSMPAEVITLDLQMPVMDGWGFRLLQQRDPALADIPVIVVSGCETRGDIDATAFFTKPCDFEELLAAVAAHGRRYREEHRAQA